MTSGSSCLGAWSALAAAACARRSAASSWKSEGETDRGLVQSASLSSRSSSRKLPIFEVNETDQLLAMGLPNSSLLRLSWVFCLI